MVGFFVEIVVVIIWEYFIVFVSGFVIIYFISCGEIRIGGNYFCFCCGWDVV